jgi:hypothetical protein
MIVIKIFLVFFVLCTSLLIIARVWDWLRGVDYEYDPDDSLGGYDP